MYRVVKFGIDEPCSLFEILEISRVKNELGKFVPNVTYKHVTTITYSRSIMENIKNHSSRSSYFKKTVAIDASTYNRLIHNLVKHLRWIFQRKQLTAYFS